MKVAVGDKCLMVSKCAGVPLIIKRLKMSLGNIIPVLEDTLQANRSLAAHGIGAKQQI